MLSNAQQKEVINYGVDAEYIVTEIEEAIQKAGVKPLDTCPAQWWNFLWYQAAHELNSGLLDMVDVRNELIAVIQAGLGHGPQGATGELYAAINALRNTIATATAVGAVKASTDIKSVNVDDSTGVMLVNALSDWDDTSTIQAKINALQTAIRDEATARYNKDTSLQAAINGKQATLTAGTNITISGNTISATDTTYTTATSTTAGLVKSATTGTKADRDYNVQVNEDGTMKVNVPWENTNDSWGLSFENGKLSIVRNGGSSEVTIPTSAVRATYARYLVPDDTSTSTKVNVSPDGQLNCDALGLN